MVSELHPQLYLDGCYRSPEPHAELAVKLVDLPDVIKARPSGKEVLLLEREPVPAEAIVVKVAQVGDGKLHVSYGETSPFHLGELLFVGCGVGKRRKR